MFISADVTGLIDQVTGQVDLQIAFSGFEFFLGAILGSLTAIVVWSNLKNLK